MHPWINREVKCAFRWYRSPRLRYRNRAGANDPDASSECPSALPFPARTILPFQALLSPSTTSIASWQVKDLSGNVVADLATSIPELALQWYAAPSRAIVCLEEPLVITTLPEGVFEMEITTAEGEVAYSETFELLAACNGHLLTNSDLSLGASGWSHPAPFNNVLAAIANNSLLPTSGMQVFDAYLCTGDNLIYVWNGTSFDANTPANGSYWGLTTPGTSYWRYTGGAFVLHNPLPLYLEAPSACWTGVADVFPLAYTVPSEYLPGLVRLTFSVWRGSPIIGSVTVTAGGQVLGTFSQADNGVLQTFLVHLQPGATIDFVPSSGFAGCIDRPKFYEVADGSECMTRLQWWNCGDLGTVAYNIGSGAFTNILYLRDAGTSLLAGVNDQTPQVEEETERMQDGSSISVRRRKEVEWRLEIGWVPWHVIDALSEMIVSGERRIQVPWGDEADEMITARMETQWANKDSLATGAVLFRVDEATSASGCCSSFAMICHTPCVTADGVVNIDELVEGDIYLLDDGRAATYCGPECEEPVDEFFFKDHIKCPYGYAMLRDGRLVRYAEGVWQSAVDLFSVEAINDCAQYSVIAILPTGYTGRMEWTDDGQTWRQFGAPFTAAEGAAGIVFDRPTDAMYLRVVAMGHECDLGVSLPVPAPCACPVINFNANLEANCGSLPANVTINAIPFNREGGDALPMPAMGEEVTMFYRIDGGAWVPMEVQTPGSPNTYYAITGVPYATAGEELEVMVFFTDRPWCESQVSQVFACPE